jgi:hypothetical protein
MGTLSISSIHTAAMYLQATPSLIRRVADRLGIQPAETVNGLDYYLDADVDRMGAHLATHRTGGAFHLFSIPPVS